MTKNLDKEGFRSIIDNYQLFYIDLWGVVHNGISADEEAINPEGDGAIALGVSVLAALGTHDVGQSIVVQNGRVIAIEAAEGSDAMIARSATLLDPDGGVACFVKMAKSAQDLRLDMPVFGGDTIRFAATAGLSLLAVEAETVLMADDLASIRATCAAHSITLIGIERQGRP